MPDDPTDRRAMPPKRAPAGPSTLLGEAGNVEELITVEPKQRPPSVKSGANVLEMRRDAPSELGRLVRRAMDRDESAFSELHRRYATMVHAILLSRAPASAVEDLQQEVFLTALKRIADVRDPDAFPGWLAQIARRAAVDHHRRRPGHEPLGQDLPARAGSTQQRVEAERVMDGIRGLPEDYGELLIMRLVEGLSGPEIAGLLGLSPGYVRVKLHRGLAMLREHLGIRKEHS